MLFQSTLPARGATLTLSRDGHRMQISIHAPRTGSDWERYATDLHNKHFNPRSPHGERQIRCMVCVQLIRISIHAPRTGSDMKWKMYFA